MMGNTLIFEEVKDFHLPRYHEIPNVGLYLKQVVKLMNESLEPYFQITVTETMLSNYVKKHIVANPIKKQYYRQQIAPLIFIVLAKTILSLDNIQKLLAMQEQSFEQDIAYDYFCDEFENILLYVYGLKDSIDTIGESEREEKKILQNLIVTIAHKLYLEKELS